MKPILQKLDEIAQIIFIGTMFGMLAGLLGLFLGHVLFSHSFIGSIVGFLMGFLIGVNLKDDSPSNKHVYPPVSNCANNQKKSVKVETPVLDRNTRTNSHIGRFNLIKGSDL